jgi:hypothetical protein
VSYLDSQASALRMLREKGQLMTISREAEGDYDPDTSTTSDAGPQSFSAYGVPLPLDRGLRLGDGTTVQATDQQLLLPAVDQEGADLVVQLDDVVTFGGRGYKIVDASELSPGGVRLLWDCVIRGGGA